MSSLALLRAFLLAFLAIGAFGDHCPEKYKHFSAKHTYCLPVNGTCDIRRSKVTEEQKIIILDEHNKYRSSIAKGELDVISFPTASHMMQLDWDDELAEGAQKHTDQCVFAHDCNECRRIPNFWVGQNLYMDSLQGGSEPQKADWKSAVKSWTDEVKFFRQEYIEPFVPSTPYGHFTQVSWGSTWKVGCGYSLFADGKDKFTAIYCCNYGPGGNMVNGAMYKKGEPCSNCPVNSCCDDTCQSAKTYPGLCHMLSDEAPKYNTKDDAQTFSCTFSGEEDCDFTTDGKEWEVVETLSGNYVGIVLTKGEKSKLAFTKPFAGEGGSICFSYYYSKGAELDGEPVRHEAMQHFKVVGAMTSTSTLPDGEGKNVLFKMSLGWDQATTVEFEFSVPQGAQPQFLQISDLKAKSGEC